MNTTMNNLKQTYSNWDVQESRFQNKQCLDEQRLIRDLSFFLSVLEILRILGILLTQLHFWIMFKS